MNKASLEIILSICKNKEFEEPCIKILILILANILESENKISETNWQSSQICSEINISPEEYQASIKQLKECNLIRIQKSENGIESISIN